LASLLCCQAAPLSQALGQAQMVSVETWADVVLVETQWAQVISVGTQQPLVLSACLNSFQYLFLCEKSKCKKVSQLYLVYPTVATFV